MDEKKSQLWKMRLADTAALLLYDITTGILVVLYEVYFAGFGGEEVIWVRVLYSSRYLGARLCGRLTDRFRTWILGGSKNFFKRALADTVSVSLYQSPIYAISTLIMGMSTSDMWTALGIHFVVCVLLGWLYGRLLDRLRAYFRIRK